MEGVATRITPIFDGKVDELKLLTKKLKEESKRILGIYEKTFLCLEKNIDYYKKAIKDTDKKHDLELYFNKLIKYKEALKLCEKNLAWIDKKFNKHPQEVKDLAVEKLSIFYQQLPEEIKGKISEDSLRIIVKFITEFHDIGRHLEVNLKTLQKENFGIDHAVLGADFLLDFFKKQTFDENSYLAQCIDFAIRNHSTTSEQEQKITKQQEDKLKGRLLHFLKQMDMLANLQAYAKEGGLENIGEWGWVNKEGFNVKSADISKEVLQNLENGQLVDVKNIKTMGDVICKYISWLNIIDDCYCSKEDKQNITKSIIEQAQKTFNNKRIVHHTFDQVIKEMIETSATKTP